MCDVAYYDCSTCWNGSIFPRAGCFAWTCKHLGKQWNEWMNIYGIQTINTTFTSYNGFLSHILLPCLSLFQGSCRFFPQCETTSCVRTAVGILIVPIGTTCLCCRKYGNLWLRSPLSKIGNVAYTVSPNPSGENVLCRRRCCWWRWLFHSWYGFFLCTAPSYPL